MDLATAHALVRFGLGPRPDTPPPEDARAWLRAQLAGPDPASPYAAAAAAMEAMRADRDEKPPPGRSRSRGLFIRDSQAALAAAITTPAPFRERLVWFWTNHFTVSVRRGICAPLIGPFVAEAIRPHVTGRFADMLVAVMRHPAMLLYLDNAESVGPSSTAGLRTGRGLNENLARECLELHTVSPQAGYSQADVTNFARILTGWSIELNATPPGFKFRPLAHEPGEKVLMGRTFPPGEQGGMMALAFLAAHPATHRHLATRLARHFVADDPPPDAVRVLEGVLRDSDGDLGAAAAALAGLRAAWQPGTKLRSPQEYLVGVMRALGLNEAPPHALAALRLMGQPFWSAPQPDGWPDRAADWASAEGMMRRVDVAYAIGSKAAAADAASLARLCLGPLLRPATLDAIRRAGSRREAIALLFTAPEFQRR